MTLTKSTSPAASSRASIDSPVGASMPPGSVSSTAMRMPTMKSGPTRSRIAVSTRSPKRMRLSIDPP